MKLSEVRKTGKNHNQNTYQRKKSVVSPVNTSESIPEVEETQSQDIEEEMQEIYLKCASALNDYTAQLNIDDWKKETLTRWRGACEYIGRTVFKGTRLLKDIYRRDTGSATATNYNAYDYEKLSLLLDYYSELCHRYDKPVTTYNYADFCGMAYEDYTRFVHRLTPASGRLFQKSFDMQHADLTNKAIQGGGVTLIATLNHVHGWDKDRQAEKTAEVNAIEAHNLPLLGDSK